MPKSQDLAKHGLRTVAKGKAAEPWTGWWIWARCYCGDAWPVHYEKRPNKVYDAQMLRHMGEVPSEGRIQAALAKEPPKPRKRRAVKTISGMESLKEMLRW